jgi:protein TonB
MSAAPPLSSASGADWAHALRRPAEVSRGQTRLLVATMAALHLGAGWALLQVPAVRQAVLETAPMMVELLAPPTPALPPPKPVTAPPLQPRPAPVLAAPSPVPLPAEATTAPPPPTTPAPAPAEPVSEATPVAVVAAPATPAPPPARKLLAATAVRYLVQPPVEVPLASRRAGESGVVWLRVVVDVRGLPAQLRVQRTSGHARLDEQALWAMRQARFQPHTENGSAIEVEVIAPIDYPLE